jgi:hypothetical protein
MKVLVACEYSGIVRDAFVAKGHDAWSCDILPTESPGNHFEGDVLEHLDKGWDLMIAHPPCTHLAVSGARWFTEGKNPWSLQEEALDFVRKLLDVTKKTCLWLKNLPNLKPTKIVEPDIVLVNGKKMSRMHYESFKLPPKERGKARSRFYEGIAEAMADQWG